MRAGTKRAVLGLLQAMLDEHVCLAERGCIDRRGEARRGHVREVAVG